jgi:5-methylcytosine-specific restriction endonuclease McrA
MTKRALIQSKFGNRCAYCGRELDYREVILDHVVPKCKGGTKDEENLYPACRSCNEMKASLDMDELEADGTRYVLF